MRTADIEFKSKYLLYNRPSVKGPAPSVNIWNITAIAALIFAFLPLASCEHRVTRINEKGEEESEFAGIQLVCRLFYAGPASQLLER